MHSSVLKNKRIYIFRSLPEDMCIDFRERGRERERNIDAREKLIGCLPYGHLLGIKLVSF